MTTTSSQNMTSIPTTDLVPAGDVEIVASRLGAELQELERRLAAATQVAVGAEDRARSAGADLEASIWTLVRLQRFVERTLAEGDAENDALLDLARVRAGRIRAGREVDPPSLAPQLSVAAPTTATTAAAAADSDSEPDPGPAEVVEPFAVAPGGVTAPAVDEAWDVLDGVAGRDPDEPFWPGETHEDPEASTRVVSVNSVLRLGSVACLAAAAFLRFG